MVEKIKTALFSRTIRKRTMFFIFSDIVLISLAGFLGFLLRFDGDIPERYFPTIGWLSVISAGTVILLFYAEKLYAISWSFVSIKELLRLIKAVTIAFLIIGLLLFLLKDYGPFTSFPRSIIFTAGFMAMIFTGTLRFAKRIYLNGFKKQLSLNTKKLLIFGAGETGEQLIRYIINHGQCRYLPIGFIDDNPMKQGVTIHGVKVIGNTKDIPDLVKRFGIDELIISAPSASRQTVKRIILQTHSAGLNNIKILSGTDKMLEPGAGANQVRNISIEDLLGREKITIDTREINSFLAGKKVLVTGAAGSIGSHLCRQILKFNPSCLIGLDQNETAIFHLERELGGTYPQTDKIFVIGDICNWEKIDHLFNATKPDIIFHAAAYKHVSMMENHPDEAIRNNIFGTLSIGRAAIKHQAQKFVLISTDKAINPTSIMGASKRAAEMVAVWLGRQNVTKFCAVRFGNVLDSQGNVVGIFENQIRNGGPIEVTHPDMKRYFMVTSEACLLVMQASALGDGGEVFVLDMGEPVKIVDLAKEMIRLAGFEPNVDIPIVFTGARQGEKLFEELLTTQETPTKHEKIYISKLNDIHGDDFMSKLDTLKQSLQNNSRDELLLCLNALVPNLNLNGPEK